MKKILFSSFLLFFIASSISYSQTEELKEKVSKKVDGGDYYGVFIGINYENNDENTSLVCAENDALAMYYLFTWHKYISIGPDSPRFIYDVEGDYYNEFKGNYIYQYQPGCNIGKHKGLLLGKEASSINIGKAIKQLKSYANSKDDLALFYFSGHGITVQGEEALVPYNANLWAEDLVQEASVITISELKKKFSEFSGEVIVILDMCLTKDKTSETDSSLRPKSPEINDIPGENPFEHYTRNMTIITSCSPKESSYEHLSLGHGIFTDTLLKILADNPLSKISDIPKNIPVIYNNKNQNPGIFGYHEMPKKFLPFFTAPDPIETSNYREKLFGELQKKMINKKDERWDR